MESTRDVIVQSERFDDAIAFYRDVLGFEQTVATDKLVGFETGSFQLFVEPGTAPGPVFEMLFDDLDAAKQRLLANGCTIVDDDPSVPRCYVRDPHGLVFNISER
jgi:catechol 2,3-dioxygenase-like lactoylglutathione lyase family enzyme